MNETGHDRRDDIAAYLLGALEPGEAAELERHVAGCAECEDELRRRGSRRRRRCAAV
jgi:anti-sigma factor RsiW